MPKIVVHRLAYLAAFLAIMSLSVATVSATTNPFAVENVPLPPLDFPSARTDGFVPPPPLPRGRFNFRVGYINGIHGSVRRAAHLSSMAYRSDSIPDVQILRIPRYRSLPGGSETFALLFIDQIKRTVSISVRGTANFDDALLNIKAVAQMDKHLGIPLHAGFGSAASEVYEALKPLIVAQQLQNYEFELTGHSLGGAIAAILAMHLQQDGANIKWVITFGAPRFTTNEGARRYQVLNQKTHRIIRCDDVVPFLPPPNFFGWSTGAYEATGNVLLLLKPPYFDSVVNQEIERDFTHQLRLEAENAGNRLKVVFGHRMESYSNLIEKFSPLMLGAAGFEGGVQPMVYSERLQGEYCPARLS